jgi:hypothetical protein
MLEELGRIRGRSGIEVYEEMTDHILRNGKPKPGSETAAIKAELEQLKKREEEREKRAKSFAESAQIQAVKRGWETTAQDESRFPSIAFYAKQTPAQLAEIVAEIDRAVLGHYHATGQPLDHGVAFANLEALLKPHADAARQTGTPDAGRETSRTSQKPVVGKQVSPNRAASASARRNIDELSDEERWEEAKRDPGSILSAFGF